MSISNFTMKLLPKIVVWIIIPALNFHYWLQRGRQGGNSDYTDCSTKQPIRTDDTINIPNCDGNGLPLSKGTRNLFKSQYIFLVRRSKS